jgi:hypothetical protein
MDYEQKALSKQARAGLEQEILASFVMSGYGGVLSWSR